MLNNSLRLYATLNTLRKIKNIFEMECAAIHPDTRLCLQATTICSAADHRDCGKADNQEEHLYQPKNSQFLFLLNN